MYKSNDDELDYVVTSTIKESGKDVYYSVHLCGCHNLEELDTLISRCNLEGKLLHVADIKEFVIAGYVPREVVNKHLSTAFNYVCLTLNYRNESRYKAIFIMLDSIRGSFKLMATATYFNAPIFHASIADKERAKGL